jgi:hypothetical protein
LKEKEEIIREWGVDLLDPNSIEVDIRDPVIKKETVPICAALEREAVLQEVEDHYQEDWVRKVVVKPILPTHIDPEEKRKQLLENSRFSQQETLIFFNIGQISASRKYQEEEVWQEFHDFMGDFSDPIKYLIRRAKGFVVQAQRLEKMLEGHEILDCTSNKIHARKGRKTLHTFASLEEAVQAGFSEIAIRKCLIGKAKTHRGYRWEQT